MLPMAIMNSGTMSLCYGGYGTSRSDWSFSISGWICSVVVIDILVVIDFGRWDWVEVLVIAVQMQVASLSTRALRREPVAPSAPSPARGFRGYELFICQFVIPIISMILIRMRYCLWVPCFDVIANWKLWDLHRQKPCLVKMLVDSMCVYARSFGGR